jgi:hypothetical protein
LRCRHLPTNLVSGWIDSAAFIVRLTPCRSATAHVSHDATKRENTHRRSAPARCSGLSESPLTRVEHQAIYGELHVNVGESGVRQRLLLLLFGHVERDASR